MVQATQILRDQHGSCVPRTMPELMVRPACWGGRAIRPALILLLMLHLTMESGRAAGDVAAGLPQALPGVGPKMALIVLRVNTGEVAGISVDTHVHRICNQLGWTKKPTKTPEQTRAAIESWMPARVWADVNLVLVNKPHAHTVCGSAGGMWSAGGAKGRLWVVAGGPRPGDPD